MTATPAGWTSVPLRNLVDVLDSQRVPVNAKDRAERPGKVPYYGATGPVGTMDTALFNEPLLLLGEDGIQFLDAYKPKAYLVDGPAWVNNHAHVLRPDVKLVDRHYLKYYLDAFNYHGYANGTTRLKLTKAAMLSIPVLLAPRPEQDRIVAKLDELQGATQVALAQIGVLEQRMAALRELTLRGFLPRDGEHTLTIREVADLGSGATPAKSEASYYTGGTIPWLTSGDLNSRVVERAHQFITAKALKETSVKAWPAGTLLVAMYGEGQTRGRAARLAFESTTNQACAAIRVRPDAPVTVEFLHAFFDATYQRNRRLGGGGVQPNLSLRVVREIEVPVRPRAEQARLVARYEGYLDQQRGLLTQLSGVRFKLRALEVRALRRAWSGNLVSRDPSDEPAETLLTRHQSEVDKSGGAAEESRTRTPRGKHAAISSATEEKVA